MKSKRTQQIGSITLLDLVRLREEQSTEDQFEVYRQRTLGVQRSSTLLQGLEVGRTPYDSQVGQTIVPSGQEAAPVNRFQSQGSKKDSTTTGTSGQTGSISLKSANLQSSLASRLVVRLDDRGSTLFRLTWKVQVTPLQRQIWALRASVLRTSDSVYSSWPTPIVNDMLGSTHCYVNGNHNKIALKLPGAAKLAGWPTTTTRDYKDGQSVGNVQDNSLLGRVVWTAFWATPRCPDKGHLVGSLACAKKNKGRLEDQVFLAHQTTKVSGQAQSGSHAPTAKVGQLNPAHSRWLMGYPESWDNASPHIDAWREEIEIGRLKGYGNAIVPQVAAIFIQSFLDVILE